MTTTLALKNLQKLVISESERKAKQKILFDKEPVLKLKNLKTYFPIRNGFFGEFLAM